MMGNMTTFLSNTASALYNGIISIPSSIASNPKMTFSPLIAGAIGALSGAAASALTGGRVQLNKLIPETIRDNISMIGHKIGFLIANISVLAANTLKIHPKTLSQLVVTPVIEELIFRLPLLIACSGIDSLSL